MLYFCLIDSVINSIICMIIKNKFRAPKISHMHNILSSIATVILLNEES